MKKKILTVVLSIICISCFSLFLVGCNNNVDKDQEIPKQEIINDIDACFEGNKFSHEKWVSDFEDKYNTDYDSINKLKDREDYSEIEEYLYAKIENVAIDEIYYAINDVFGKSWDPKWYTGTIQKRNQDIENIVLNAINKQLNSENILTSGISYNLLDELERMYIESERIYNKVNELLCKNTATYDEQLNLAFNIARFNCSNCKYYVFKCEISLNDINEKVLTLKDEASLSQSTGGYYANEKDKHVRPGPFDPEGNWETTTHYGDFKVCKKSVEKLDSYYQIYTVVSTSVYFRGDYLSGLDSIGGISKCMVDGDYIYIYVNNEWNIYHKGSKLSFDIV